jgi:TrmH family RNA methyltransferase
MVPESKKDDRGKNAGAERGLRNKVTHSVCILLVRPMYPGNVGSVARVMKNLGFRRLGIVSDLDPRDEPEAFWMAHGARDLLEAASMYADLDEALGSFDLVIGTTSRRGTRWREALDPEGLVDLLTAGWDWRPTALLFGPEDRGLSVKELSRCRWVARIPTCEDCPSMNLSHAVALICYILARGSTKVPECSRSGAVPPGETQRLIDEAGALLKKMNFLTGDASRNQTAMRNLQRLIVKASPNKPELAWLWALLRHIERQTR